MESPPSSSTWSERFILSDDSGLLLTNSSISSGSSSKSGRNRLPLEDSDCDDDKSFSQDSLDGMSDIICGENFNTLKKGPNCMDFTLIKYSSPIEPPLEFQDQPEIIENFSNQLAKKLLKDAIYQLREDLLNQIKYEQRSIQLLNRSYYTSEFIQFSPCHHQHHHHYNHHYYNYHSSSNNSNGRPGSRSSLGSSRLSSSHNSLSVPSAHKVDDSSFITQAVSHDTLSTNQISDLYNVPFDSDVYAVPIDMIKPPPPLKPRRNQQQQQQQQQQTKKRRRNTSSGCREIEGRQIRNLSTSKRNIIKFDKLQYQWCLQKSNKRHSVADSSGDSGTVAGGGGGGSGGNEPIHMTLQEVRHYLQTLYSSSSDSSDHKEKQPQIKQKSVIETTDDKINNENNTNGVVAMTTTTTSRITNGRLKKNTFLINIKNKKIKDSCDNSHVSKKIDTANNNNNNNYSNNNNNKLEKVKKSPPKLFSFKQTLCNMFRFKRFLTPEHIKCDKNTMKDNNCNNISIDETLNNITSRALPPLPQKDQDDKISTGEQQLDFATSIQRVKDYGWYWGPLSGEVAEKILSNEPDGSFIVRDSSDDHYIFSLTFKLNNCVRHVRIDHDQGNFSFGSCTKFKSQTIVEFIENAVEHSRSGRYLFFLHRRPVIGPVRVQLLHPVSRFKQVQSLQHICRFVIHKNVRRDLITNLPLPRRMIDYLNTPHYYSEHLIDIEDTTNSKQTTTPVPTPAIRRDYHDNDDGENDSQIPINNYIVLNNNNNDPNDNDNVSRQS